MVKLENQMAVVAWFIGTAFLIASSYVLSDVVSDASMIVNATVAVATVYTLVLYVVSNQLNEN